MCSFRNILFLAILFSFADITMKHHMTAKCKISLQNVLKMSFLHIEKHNKNHIEVDIESRSENGVLKNSERLTS